VQDLSIRGLPEWSLSELIETDDWPRPRRWIVGITSSRLPENCTRLFGRLPGEGVIQPNETIADERRYFCGAERGYRFWGHGPFSHCVRTRNDWRRNAAPAKLEWLA
jgi:hypothetical protein